LLCSGLDTCPVLHQHVYIFAMWLLSAVLSHTRAWQVSDCCGGQA
jgi:hypothetical protein